MPGPDVERPETGDAEQAYGLARVLALSDGVFAFALTLLVVELIVPTLSRSQLGQQLLDQAPRLRAASTGEPAAGCCCGFR